LALQTLAFFIYHTRVSPEKNLWLEVLFLALLDFCNDRVRAVRGRNRVENYQHDAARWFESSAREPGSFLFVAQALDIDASALRKVLLTADKTTLHRRLSRQCAWTDYRRERMEMDWTTQFSNALKVAASAHKKGPSFSA
jgi:hypothetical protein